MDYIFKAGREANGLTRKPSMYRPSAGLAAVETVIRADSLSFESCPIKTVSITFHRRFILLFRSW